MRSRSSLFAIAVALACTALIWWNINRAAPGPHITTNRELVQTGLLGALDKYHADLGRWPHALDELVDKPTDTAEAAKWRGPYTKRDHLKNVFGVDWRYKAHGEHNPDRYDLSSAGRDGQWGTSDDVANWDK